MEAPSNQAGFLMERQSLPYHLPSHFETFYRTNLRFVPGSRVRSSELHERYMRWAMQHGAASVSLTLQREFMEVIGHRRVRSDGMHFDDAGYAEAHPDVADTLRLPLYRRPDLPRDSRATAALLHKVDAALASLLDLRRAIVAARETVAPHVAAQLALGLIDQ